MVERYLLREVILVDGSGALHVALDSRLHRTVDVKVLRGKRPLTERRRLEREARLLAGARHEGLPLLLDARLSEDETYLVYHHVSTRKLDSLGGSVDPTTAVALARQLCSALAAAHREGILHADVRPDLILLRDTESVVVHGFGRTRARDHESDDSRCGVAPEEGFPVFIAPELLLTDEVDARVDVYGVLATLRFLLTGEPPIAPGPAANAAEMIDRVLESSPPRVEGIGSALADLIDRGLRRDPAERPASLLAVDDMLSSCLNRPTLVPSGFDGGLALGSTVAGFRVRAMLGAGGFGRVYLATDERLDRDVALKQFADARARPGTEGRALAKVKHPNVVRVFTLVEHENETFLVTELAPGDSLETRLASDGPPPMLTACALLDQIAAGLQAVHEAGVIHGDLKPANVIVDGSWNAKLIDFGLASFAGDASNTRAMTPAYCAPELAFSKDPSTRSRASDVYAFGVTAFELLTDALPFEHSEVGAMLRAHQRDIPRLPSAVDRSRAPFDGLIRGCLAKRTELRPTLGEVRVMLREIAGRITSPLRGRRVLVIEDDATLRESLMDALSALIPDGDVRVAVDGDAALKLLETARYDVVLLDLALPRRSGLEVLAEIQGSFDPAPAVVVMSGTASGEDWRLVSALGARGRLHKPIDLDLLELTLRRVVE